MNTSSHILIGNFLCRYLNVHYGILLDKKNYILGNVLPDYSPSFLVRPHYLKNNAGYVQKILQFLVSQDSAAYNDKRQTRLLGILCHFYADFFCFAHREEVVLSLPEHIRYESKLHHYFTNHFQQLDSLCFGIQPRPENSMPGLYRQFEELHAGYLSSSPSFGNDLIYALTACIEMTVSICGRTQRAVRQMPLFL